MTVSLNGVDAWRPDDRLVPGTYLAKSVAVERKMSSSLNPQVQVDWRVLNTDSKGAEQRDWITFTDASLGNIAMVVDAAGIERPGEDFASHEAMRDWLATQLEKGAIVEMIIRNDSYVDRDGVTREGAKVKGYRRPNEGDLAGDTSGFASGPKVAADEPALPF